MLGQAAFDTQYLCLVLLLLTEPPSSLIGQLTFCEARDYPLEKVGPMHVIPSNGKGCLAQLLMPCETSDLPFLILDFNEWLHGASSETEPRELTEWRQRPRAEAQPHGPAPASRKQPVLCL